jgi:DNA-binding transcriptional ArsR family regulator
MSIDHQDTPDSREEAADCVAEIRRSTEDTLSDNERATLDSIEAFLRDSKSSDAYGDAGFVLASKYRAEMLRLLADRPGTPSQLDERRDETGLAHVSRALQEMRERGLVELLVPDAQQKGRVYGITAAGEAALTKAEKLEGDA